MKKRILLGVLICVLVLFGLSYIPQPVVSLSPSKISKITVFNGGTGYEIDITDERDIRHIINNLNDVTFQKGKTSFGYMGYSFDVTIYNHKGKPLKELIINSEDTIRYKGFFHTATKNEIDYEYINRLFGD